MNTQENKVTPLHDLSWYIKWTSSLIIVVAMALTSQNIYPLNIFFQFVGVFGWLLVGLLWHDRALIVLNAIGIVFLGAGVIKYYNECIKCITLW